MDLDSTSAMALIVNRSAASWAAPTAAISSNPTVVKISTENLEGMVSLHCKVFRINYLYRMAKAPERGRPMRQRCRIDIAVFEHLAEHQSICHSSKYNNFAPKDSHGHRTPARDFTRIHEPRRIGLGRQRCEAHAAGSHPLVRRNRGRISSPGAGIDRRPGVAAARSEKLSRLRPVPLRSV